MTASANPISVPAAKLTTKRNSVIPSPCSSRSPSCQLSAVSLYICRLMHRDTLGGAPQPEIRGEIDSGRYREGRQPVEDEHHEIDFERPERIRGDRFSPRHQVVDSYRRE